jgi:hypothetical protein
MGLKINKIQIYLFSIANLVVQLNLIQMTIDILEEWSSKVQNIHQYEFEI